VDEVGLEVRITMPGNYPLGLAAVESTTDMGIKTYRKWLLQMTAFLANQVRPGLAWPQLWQGLARLMQCWRAIHTTY
jgi:hypothetical protein